MMIEKVTYRNLMSTVGGSAVGIDPAKNHTGVAIWNGSDVELYGFALPETSGVHAEFDMRLAFKKSLGEILFNKNVKYCVIEDVYGGQNFETVRKLLAVNTVVDELIHEGVFKCEEFYRQPESVWMSNLRWLYKQPGQLRVKYETQGILDWLDFGYYKENVGQPESWKKADFFEDKCDAAGMLLSVAAMKARGTEESKAGRQKKPSVGMAYLNWYNGYKVSRNKVIRLCEPVMVKLECKNVESEVLMLAMENPGKVLCAYLPVERLGTFGAKNGFEFYEDGEGYLFFYLK